MHILGNDFVINENDCNFKCQYCLTSQSNYKIEHSEKRIYTPPKIDTYCKGTKLYKSLNYISSMLQKEFNHILLKITGGELFLIKNIIEFIEEQSSKYEMLIVQSNGILVSDKIIERLKN